jgi:murein L,D-transpeptidase YcbB/YkuD
MSPTWKRFCLQNGNGLKMTVRKRLHSLAVLILLVCALAAHSLAEEAVPTKRDVLQRILTQYNGTSAIRVANERIYLPEELLTFYRERSFEPLWSTSDSQGRNQIREVLRQLDAGYVNGVSGGDYHRSFFQSLLSRYSIQEKLADQQRLVWNAWYDILLTDALFHYAIHLADGRVTADSIQDGWNSQREKIDLLESLDSTFDHDQPGRFLQGVQPAHKGYRELQKVLQRYGQIEAFGGWPSIPEGKPLRLGTADHRVGLLRTRLLLSGDLVDIPEVDSIKLEKIDIEALQHFQQRHGLIPDGLLGPQTLTALNVPVKNRLQQIVLNMERWRWLPKSLGEKYLLVNIADFRISLIEQEQVQLSMPVVVGNKYRQTPVFSTLMKYIEFAPYWYVPRTILKKDKLPVLKKDPGYLKRNHYEIVSWDKSVVIDPETVDWETIDSKGFPGILRQAPGPWNPLGRVKFYMPNQYSISLHDTNQRYLFGRRDRKFSSGCIRIKRPDALAQILLADQGWDLSRVTDAMAYEHPERYYLKESLPIHILYWTAWVDESGALNFREDIYGRDRNLMSLLSRSTCSCADKPTIMAKK